MPSPELQGAARTIVNYESLADLTERMLATAREGKWDELVSVERQRSELLAAIKLADAVAVLDEAATRQKHDLIVKIQAHDAEIRTLTQAWLDDFRTTMQSSRQELRLARKYGL